jgi:cytochrome c oxidase subunit 3
MDQSASRTHYAVPQPMPWPIMGSTALFLMALGGVFVMNGHMGGWVSIAAGLMLLIYMMVRWFGDVIRESEGGKYSGWEDLSFRWGMSWFIFSEVMFFGAFFGALFWMRQVSVPDLSTIESNALVWPGFTAKWPSAGPAFAEAFSPMAAWGIPAINTMLLLSSGVTVTIAHWAMKVNNRKQLILWLTLTILLGALFLGLQAWEYGHAYKLTGFHGFHVTCGALMLTVILFRCIAGHFKPDQHFGFEGVAWYWHFVDVVWLGLFIFVYWL